MNNYLIQSALPLVSVIVPAYNAELFIEETLNSILTQTYKNIEVLVVDDGSQDQTAAIVERVMQRDSRIELLRQPNAGVATARNLAIQKARGEFIAPVDADDIWFPQNLEKQVQCLVQAEPTVGLVYAWSADIDEQGLLTGEFRASMIAGEVYATLLCHNFLGNASASLIRRACFEKVGSYSCQMKKHHATGCEDWDLYLRIAEFYQFRVVPEFLIGYRKLPGTMSCDYRRMAQSHELMLQSVYQKYPEMPALIYRLSRSSFYMYLAHQSHQRGSHQSTLFWLYRAWRVDWITPILRYGLYILAIQSLWGLMTQLCLSRSGSSQASKQSFNHQIASDHKITIADLNRPGIHFKVLVGSTLHRVIPILLGTRKLFRVS